MKFYLKRKQYGAVLAFSLVMLLLLTLAGTGMIQQNKQQLTMALNMRDATQKFADTEGILAQAKNLLNADPSNNNYTTELFAPLSNSYFPASTRLSIYDAKHQCRPTTGYNQSIIVPGAYSFLMAPSLPNGVVAANAPLYCNDSANKNKECVKVEISSVACMSTTVWHKCIDYLPASDTYTCYHGNGIVPDGDPGDTTCSDKVKAAYNAKKNNDAVAYNNAIDNLAAFFSDPSDVCYQPYDPLCANPDSSTNNPNPRCRAEPPNMIPLQQCPYVIYKLDVLSQSATGSSREIISDHVIACGT